MKPVYQDKFGDEGNCLQACIASLLEIQLDEVPHFMETERGWFNEVNVFLWKLGYHMVSKQQTALFPHNCYYLGWGKSPRGIEHSVIYYNGDMAHDPHPDGGGVDLSSIAYFVARFNRSSP